MKHRIWVYTCADCQREALTRDAALYRYWHRRGYCAACRQPSAEQLARWRLEYLGLSIAYRLERIQAQAERLPESKRPPLRVLYAKRRRQLKAVRAQLAALPITVNSEYRQPAEQHAA